MSHKQSGSGIFSKKPDFRKKFDTAKKSEKKLLDTYSSKVKAIKKYNEAIKTHYSNLIALDATMPKDFKGFFMVFEKDILNDLKSKEKPNTRSPLLLKNYRVSDEFDRDDLARHHFWQQCEYIRLTKFPPEEAMLVSKIGISDIRESKFTMTIVGVNFAKDNYRTIDHSNFRADLAQIKGGMSEIIKNIQKDIMTNALNDNVKELNNLIAKSAPEIKKNNTSGDPSTDIFGVDRFYNEKKPEIKPPTKEESKEEFGQEKPPVFGEKNDFLSTIGQPPAVKDAPPIPGLEAPNPPGFRPPPPGGFAPGFQQRPPNPRFPPRDPQQGFRPPPQGRPAHGFQPPGPGFQPPGPGFRPPGGQGFQPPGGKGFQPPGGQGFQPPGGQGFQPPGGQGFQPPGGQGFGHQRRQHQPIQRNFGNNGGRRQTRGNRFGNNRRTRRQTAMPPAGPPAGPPNFF